MRSNREYAVTQLTQDVLDEYYEIVADNLGFIVLPVTSEKKTELNTFWTYLLRQTTIVLKQTKKM